MSGFAALTETIAVPAWFLGAAAALVVALFVFAFHRSGNFGALVRLYGILMVGLLAWAVLEHVSVRDRVAERQALDARLSQFAGLGMAPGSPLTCLDAVAGEAVETACEKALFATPEAVASAVSYVSAGLELLTDGVAFANRGEETYQKKLASLRRALETDRYGIVAHVLASRENCNAEQCGAFALLQDPSHVKANLLAGTFDSYVSRHAEAWSNGAQPATPVADVPNAPASGAQNVASAGGTAAPVSSRYTFPSADSIPAVSIMNPEPTGPVPDDVPVTASAPPAIAHPPMPPRRPAPRTAQRQSAPVPLLPPPGVPGAGTIAPPPSVPAPPAQ